MKPGPRQSRRRGLVALAAAIGLHLLVLPLAEVHLGAAARPTLPAATSPTALPVTDDALAAVTLIDEAPPSAELLVVPGAGDELHWGPGHPMPSIVDASGRRAAALGGIGAGGPESAGDRRYREQGQTEVWNGVRGYRNPRDGADREASSDEWISRAPERGYDDQTRVRRRKARAGEERGARGADDGVGERSDGDRGTPARWATADPVFDRGARKRIDARSPGEVAPAASRAMTEDGARSSDTGQRGAERDDRRASAASTARHRDPIDLPSPAAGGRDRDLRGDPTKLGNAPGWGGGTGTAANASADKGARGAVEAWRGDPYFRTMYRRVDKHVRYPEELALRLEQGHLVVRFELSADGRIAGIAVIKPSGFEDFDREVVRAIRAAAPFGAVPPSILRGKTRIRVEAPYTFRNPLIR